MNSVGTTHLRKKLPWWTWIIPFLICHIGTRLSLSFQFAPGVAILYLPIPLAIAMIFWWGPRVLAGLYLNAVLCAGLWGLPRWPLWPVYALPETLAVFSAWFFFEKIGRGKYWLPDLRSTVLFVFLAILPAACFDGFQVTGQLVILGDIGADKFWSAAWSDGWPCFWHVLPLPYPACSSCPYLSSTWD